MSLGKRLALIRIESGACNPVFPKSLNQGGLLHDRTSSRVDEARGWFHLAQFAFADQTFSLLIQKTVDCNEVGRAEHGIEVRQFHPELSSIACVGIRIVCEHSCKPKWPCQTEHLRADIAEAN